MQIRSLSMYRFMTHAKTKLVLPKTGVVLITGENGGGKSSIVEAVSVGFWGKTLRGTSPWNEENPGLVHIEASTHLGDLDVTRDRKAKTLDWHLNDNTTEYETTTKAQDALEHVVGSWDVWRRACVFSSQDAAHFTLATDAERKRLLEAILGLERFDVAQEAAKKALVIVEKTLGYAASEHASLSIQRTAAEEQLRNIHDVMTAEDLLGGPSTEAVDGMLDEPNEKLAAARSRVRKLSTSLTERDAAVAKVTQAMRVADRGDADARAQGLAAEDKAKRLAKMGECPTCTQTIPPTLVEAATKEASKAKRDAAAARNATREQVALLEAELEELKEERDLIARRVQDARSAEATAAAELRAAEERQTAAAKNAKRVALLEKQRTEAIAKKAMLEANIAPAERKIAELGVEKEQLEVVVRVLGTKGVRAHILARALSGLEATANKWLAKVAGPGLALVISPYTEKKTGGVTESIALNVTGAGGGHGYRGASGGERRRLDVALLLALAEVSAAAHGYAPGTLFADELFDALDEEGIDRVVKVLDELAKDRTVVVITHSRDLVDRVAPRAVARYVVANGKMKAA